MEVASALMLSSVQAAAHLGLTEGQFLYRVYRKKELRPSGRVGHHLTFDLEHLEAWKANPPTPPRRSLKEIIFNSSQAAAFLGMTELELVCSDIQPDGFAHNVPFWYRRSLEAHVR